MGRNSCKVFTLLKLVFNEASAYSSSSALSCQRWETRHALRRSIGGRYPNVWRRSSLERLLKKDMMNLDAGEGAGRWMDAVRGI